MISHILKVNFIITLFLFSGCSFFAEKISTLNDNKISDINFIKTQKKIVTQCQVDDRYAVTLEDENVAKFIKNDIKNIFLNSQFSFVQKAIFLSLIEIARRPDVAGLNSRFQAIVKFNNKIYYIDNEIIPSNNLALTNEINPSFYLGLVDILKIQHKDDTLLRLAKILDSMTNNFMPVSSDFEIFLNQKKNTIAKYPSLAEAFLKGEETVTKFESFPRNSFNQLIQHYENQVKKSSVKVNSFKELAFQIETKKSSSINCNKKLDDGTNETKEYEKLKTHSFSFKDGDNVFLGITSSLLSDEIKTANDKFYQFNNIPNPNALPICVIKNQNKEILVASIEGRNPHQHLKHLVNYEIDAVENYMELSDVLNFSRHLFLSNPDRILYESKKGRKSQLDFFLSKKFPIYHVENLGQIIGYSLFEKRNNLILDSRKATVLWCHK